MKRSPNQLLLSFALKHPVWIILTILMGFSGAVFNGVGATLIIPVLLEFLGQPLGQFSDLPPILAELFGLFDGLPDAYRINVMLAAVFLTIALKNLANYASLMCGASLTRALTIDMREQGLQLLLDVDLSYHFNMRAGDIIQRLNDQVSRTAVAIRTLIELARVGLNIVFFIVLLLGLSWQLTLMATALFGLIVALNQFAVSRSRRFGRNLAESSKDYSIRLLEMLNGIRLVRSTANEEHEYGLVSRLVHVREKAAFDSLANSSLIAPMNEIGSILALIFMVVISRSLFADRLDTLATLLFTYLFVLSRMIPFLGQMNGARGRFANSIASVEYVYDFLRRDNKSFMPDGTLPFNQLQSGIRFEDLTFAYPNSDQSVLKQIDLILPKGTTLALVGSSGAGKSTLADLLPRFYDVDSGRILIDGQDIRAYDVRSLRRKMGIVSQDTFLFNMSIRDNIAYASPEATEGEIVDAAKRANAYEFIERMPEGLNTLIGDRGVLLSGGQRQRLAIARALLQNPEILILDEATSALDTVSERLVQKALDDLSRDRTTLVIAHRLSTIQDADQIAVLDAGEVVEVGTHDNLVRKGGAYKQLYAMQFSETTRQIIKAAQSESVTKVSYEVRNNLNTILGSLQLLADGFVDDVNEQQELTQEAYQSALLLLERLKSSEADVQ
ncbi:MAG: ATP-binding cassette domain-containing protein [Cyanobacteria bacterium P01_H01_bin.119]